MSGKGVSRSVLTGAWVILCLVAGCARYGVQPPVTEAVTPAPLSREALANAEYLSEFASGGKARLKDGIYREKTASESAIATVITLHERYAFGDLDGDGSEDAAAILVVQSGGSGTFYYLCAVLNEEGTAVNVATLFLGDRIQVRDLLIRAGRIEVDMTVHGPKDPMVKPTRETHRTYYLSGNRLIRQKQ
ncbi:MAG TPA: hypothetical protein PLR20_09380 [Syntrophales bacterium]|nr:hypothetical protein [Syntrophales bacterium]HPI57977.1 hypothetical protein [Syntrophales bacterium]HPN25895.1 hypothetical protein [Syntrophales bacterium]HQM29549.1 hypothetical protein [Syntrophales bacterium]